MIQGAVSSSFPFGPKRLGVARAARVVGRWRGGGELGRWGRRRVGGQSADGGGAERVWAVKGQCRRSAGGGGVAWGR